MIKLDDITVAMVHFNRPCVLASTLPSWIDFKNIFVWDNNSVVQNKNWLKAYSAKNSNVRCIWSDKNVGCTKAMNRMIIDAPTDWVLLTADDMLLGSGFLSTLNDLLDWKPNLEQIYVFTYDTMLFHKKTIARFGWWEQRQNQVSPTAEDDDWYLRLVEHLGYSPYSYPGDHIHGEERKKRLQYASTKEIMERMDNISYFSNCRWGISSVNFEIKEVTRDKTFHDFNENEGEPGVAFHNRKWNETGDPKDLLNKDGTFWKRILPDEDFYPDVREQYREKYL
jgi:GT2 family glycosyltransferase